MHNPKYLNATFPNLYNDIYIFPGLTTWHWKTTGVDFSGEKYFSQSQHPLVGVLCIGWGPQGVSPGHVSMSVVAVLVQLMFSQPRC